MPATLAVDLSLTIPNTIYTAGFGFGFNGSILGGFARLTPEQAAALNGTYTLSRSTFLGQQCNYSFNNGSVILSVSVGSFSGNVGDQRIVNFPDGRVFPGPDWPFTSNTCGATNSGLANVHAIGCQLALTGTYTDTTKSYYVASCDADPLPSPDTFTVPGSIRLPRRQIGVACERPGERAFYSGFGEAGLQIDTSLEGREAPPCTSIPLAEIDHTWKYDIWYPDYANTTVRHTRIPRALVMRIRDTTPAV
jgi:hypothetical protein